MPPAGLFLVRRVPCTRGPQWAQQTAAEFSRLVGEHLGREVTPAQAALAWVIQQPGVTTVIPGARTPEQARANAAAGRLPALPTAFLEAVADLYDQRLRAAIHPRW